MKGTPDSAQTERTEEQSPANRTIRKH